MKVIAYIPAFNEYDVIHWTILHLKRQGIEPYVIDNHSADGTGVYACEKFPADGPPSTYDWTAILQRIETLAVESDADWCMLNDADEFRYSPWPGKTLVEGFAVAQQAGCNCVNFRVMNFQPTDNGWDGTQDPREHFRFYDPQSSYDTLPHVKAWRNTGRANISAHGGHFAQLEGQEMRSPSTLFPSKHYPIRSQSHGERKVFRDRVPRWNPEERARRWHEQYQGIQPGHNFIRDPKDLLEWREELVAA